MCSEAGPDMAERVHTVSKNCHHLGFTTDITLGEFLTVTNTDCLRCSFDWPLHRIMGQIWHVLIVGLKYALHTEVGQRS